MPDFHTKLGAGPASGTLQFTIFIPSVDRYGRPIDQTIWREQALRALGVLFRGATAFPPGRGVWRDDARGGELVFDDTVLVTSYASEGDVTDAALADVRRFLHQMGREAKQGEVGVVIANEYFAITEYDPP